MEQNKKDNRRNWLSYLAGFGVVMLLCVLGATLLPQFVPKKTAAGLNAVLTVVLAVWYLTNILYLRKLQQEKPKRKEIMDKVRSLRDGGDEALAVLQKDLDRMCRVNDLIALILGLLAVVMSLFLYASPGLAIFPSYTLGSLFIRYLPRKTTGDPPKWAEEGQYAELYAMAKKAQQAVGGNRPIRIALDGGCNAAVALVKGESWLFLGAILLKTFTQEEVYQILLHEFGHLKEERQLAYERRVERLGAQNALFGITDGWEADSYTYYYLFKHRKLEEQADRAILEKGNPQAAANGFAKLHCHTNYVHDFLRSGVQLLSYAPEESPRNWISFLAGDFEAAVTKNYDLALELIFNEVRPKLASHPIARDRIETLGITQVSLDFPQHQGAWGQLVEQALAWADEQFYEQVSQDYDKTREAVYLKPQQVIADWYAAGEPLTYETTRDVLEAMFHLERYGELLRLCEYFAASGASEAERCHAVFFEGMSRLKLGDKAGIEVLYQAARLNNNYIKDACDTIALYCSAHGLEEEMERYRNFTLEIEDDHLDHMDIFPLTPRDQLDSIDLDEGLFAENLQVIRSAGGEALEAVYLVKKVISQRTYNFIYILKFREGTAEELQAQAYDRVFMHLDKQEESYALTQWEDDLKWLAKRPEWRIL